MNKTMAGILAGLAATMVLSILMLMKQVMGLMPQLDLIRMIAEMMGAAVAIGWLVHFMLGATYGLVLAMGEKILPGSLVVKGLFLASIGWLMMMLLLMPMAGAGMFGMQLGIMAPMMTLVLHLVFGAVLGYAYARLRG